MAGWTPLRVRVAVAAFIGMMVSSPAINSLAPLLLAPMASDFDWGRARLTSAYALTAPIMAALFLVAGPLIDRFGVRAVLLPAIVMFGAATALQSQLDGTFAQFVAIRSLVISSGAFVTGVAFGAIVSQHFTGNRGLMLGLCLGVGGGVGMAVMPLVGAWIFSGHGWRTTYVAFGLIVICVGLAAVLALPGKDRSGIRTRQAVPLEGLPALTAVRSRAFVLLMLLSFIPCALLTGVQAHLGALMTDLGHSPQDAARALSFYAISLTLAQLSIGALLDRLSTARLIAPIFLLPLAGFILLDLGASKAAMYAAAILIGAGAGSEFAILPYLITRFFGLKAFATLYGVIYAVSAIGLGLGPYLMGLAFDRTGSYQVGLQIFSVTMLSAVIIAALLPDYLTKTKKI